MEPRTFEIFGSSHITAMLATAAAAFGLIRFIRSGGSTGALRIIQGLTALLILGGLALMMLYKAWAGTFSIHTDLPMQLCDWAGLMVAAALITGNSIVFETAYYWVLAGSTQAMLTPDIVADFPSVEFAYFFMVHSGEFIGLFILIFVSGMAPGRGSVARAFLLTNVYLVAALAVNVMTGSNYGYIFSKPPEGSLMDYLGPWPWYILSLEGVALVSYIICYLPFFIKQRRGALS